jgi:alkylation response protein AidB-like acyl-CoA dehydrogenase
VSTKFPLPDLNLLGFESAFNEQESAVQASTHRFAKEVMRPIGQTLDRMSADQAYLPGSPFWDFYKELAALGAGSELFEGLDIRDASRMESIFLTEMGWGDVGLAVSAGCAVMPERIAMVLGNTELAEMCQGKIGCGIITQPDRGSDAMTLYGEEMAGGKRNNIGGLRAKFSGDEIVINGQSSAWVTNGCVADVALLDIVADFGDGYLDEKGNTHGCSIIMPLDIKGISRGKPLAKIGKRAQPQSEIYFDNVRIPKRFAIATGKEYELNHSLVWSSAGGAMSHLSAGLARAAYELALNYVNERKQGGSLLADLQLTQYRLGRIGAKIEAMKALGRHVGEYVRSTQYPHPYFTSVTKAFSTSEMFSVVNESMQLFGGNGLTDEYPIEKLFRDARSMQIEDGETNVMFMHYGYLMVQENRLLGWGNQ